MENRNLSNINFTDFHYGPKCCVINFIAFIIALTISSCEKFVTLDKPKDQLLTTNVFENNETALAALTAIYSQLQNKDIWPYYISLYCGLSSDELENYSISQQRKEFYTNALNPRNGGYESIWTSGFNYIYQANSLLENINNFNKVSEEVKERIKGEALFIRAFVNFYLINLFGDIPSVTTTNYTINSKLSRVPIDIVYKQMILDLREAEELLSEDYVGFDGITGSSERIRPNRWAATALLARVYLYNKDYANSATLTSELINQTGLYSLEADLNNVFLKNSKEAIFQLGSAGLSTGNSNTYEGQYYILTGLPGGTKVGNSNTISQQQLDAFANRNDKRCSTWINKLILDEKDYYYPFKYKIQTSIDVSEYSTVIRLAEMYLIRAEANANQNDLVSANNDINIIRNRAGLADTVIQNLPDMLSEILKERQLELFTEWGHRWMDLKRLNKIDTIMNVVCPLKGGSWDSYKQLWPIPSSEIERDPSIIQNPGYGLSQN